MDVLVEVNVSAKTINVETAKKVLELVYRGFTREIVHRRSELHALQAGQSTFKYDTTLWGKEFLSTRITLPCAASDKMLLDLTRGAYLQVALELGSVVGTSMIEKVVDATVTFVGTVENNVRAVVHGDLTAVKRLLKR